MLRRRVRSLLPFLVAAALIVAALYRMRQVQAEQSRPYGRFSAAQILARSGSLCRAIVPQAATLRLSLDQDNRMGWDGAIHRCWTVEGTDEAGNLAAKLFWDADTGDLCLAQYTLARTHEDRATRLNRREAIRAGWGWLCRLGMVDQARSWRLVETPEQGGGNWRIRWRADDRMVFVSVDARSGAFVSAEGWRLVPSSSNGSYHRPN